MTKEAAENWTPNGQTLLATAETICDLFGRPTRTQSEIKVKVIDELVDLRCGFSSRWSSKQIADRFSRSQ